MDVLQKMQYGSAYAIFIMGYPAWLILIKVFPKLIKRFINSEFYDEIDRMAFNKVYGRWLK